MKIKTICIILSGIFLLSGIAMSLSYRSSLKHADLSDESLAHFSVSSRVDKAYEEFIKPFEDPDVDKIVNDAEMILRVRATGNRTLTKDDIFTEVVIEDVIRPYNDFKVGDSIYIYEAITVTISPYISRLNFNTLCNLMQTDEEYIVFLKFFKRPDGYKYSDKELRTFLLMDKNFALISPDKEPDYALLDKSLGDANIYDSVKNVTCIVTDLSFFEIYRDTRELLLERLKSL